jgi:hypothetical protein
MPITTYITISTIYNMEDKYEELLKYSDPDRVRYNLDKYLGKDIPLYISTRRTKKYMVRNDKGKFIHFGQMGYEDYTRHMSDIRRIRYLNRATNIRGNWRDDPYSSNNMSIHLLWD